MHLVGDLVYNNFGKTISEVTDVKDKDEDDPSKTLGINNCYGMLMLKHLSISGRENLSHYIHFGHIVNISLWYRINYPLYEDRFNGECFLQEINNLFLFYQRTSLLNSLKKFTLSGRFIYSKRCPGMDLAALRDTLSQLTYNDWQLIKPKLFK